jgi:gliding motility-associated-like protein
MLDNMRKWGLLIVINIIAYLNVLIGQVNLVPNPSFEELIQCPLNGSFTYSSLPFTTHWFRAFSGGLTTIGLFNECAESSGQGVPINHGFCYQLARTGIGYASIKTSSTTTKPTDYLEVKIKSKLQKNKKYFTSFYISPVNCMGSEKCYSDAAGLAFSDTLYQYQVNDYTLEVIPPFIPAIQNPQGNILIDTVNWIEISGFYTAKGMEQYLIIGGFRTLAATRFSGNCNLVTATHCYIDDVGVYELNDIPDTVLLCRNESKRIGRSFLDAIYSWDNGVKDSVITVNKAGRYILTTNIGKCTVKDTVVVVEIDKVVNTLPIDTLICQGESVQYDIQIPGKYIWSNGASSSSVTLKTADTYTVSVENNCGVFNRSFKLETKVCDCYVYVPNVISLNGDDINDFLECTIGCDFPYHAIRFQVFDRWGNLLYSIQPSDNQPVKWDGTYNGRTLDVGVYAWTFEYEYTRKGITTTKTISGDVTISK